jgi:hypothetical protein
MIDVGVGMGESPTALIGIGREILQHVFVNLFLQVDSDGAIGTNDFIRANPGIRGHVPTRVRNAYVGRYVSHRVLDSF